VPFGQKTTPLVRRGAHNGLGRQPGVEGSTGPSPLTAVAISSAGTEQAGRRVYLRNLVDQRAVP
jgi:hypothetical protein